MNRFRLAAVGDNCVDRFLPPLSMSLFGGNALNVAIQWARMDQESSYFGAVGPDAAGAATRRIVTENGVNDRYLVQRPGVTAYTDIQVMPSGERILAFEEFGVCRGYRPDAEAFRMLATMDHVHIGWLDDGGALRKALSAAGVSCSQDISVNNDPEHLGVAGLSVVFVSCGEAPDEAEERVTRLLAEGAAMAVATLGPLGALAATASERVRVAAETIEPVDTTGAGDSFIAGFLLARQQGLPIRECLNAGCRHAASTCLHVGSFPQSPAPLEA
jgi:fructoselysine 6-kinase